MNLPERLKDGTLPAFAWPGGYPILYLDRENSTLCAKCATKSADDADEVPQFKPVACGVYYEGPTIQCDQCNAEIESAYGDPEQKEEPRQVMEAEADYDCPGDDVQSLA